MVRTVAWILTGALVGGIIFAVTGIGNRTGTNNNISVALVESLKSDTKNLQARLEKLEQRLQDEENVRHQLELVVENFILNNPIEDAVVSDSGAEQKLSPAGTAEVATDDTSPAARLRRFRERNAQRQANLEAERTEELAAAGFAADQADYILEREAALTLDNLNDQWQERREKFLNGEEQQSPLRQELGDEDFERYLKSRGLPTSAKISQVLNAGQASGAGLKAGDEIVRFNGERVFNIGDLNNANVKGNIGEPVVVDIIRDGQPIQLTIKRGPLGIVGGGRRGGRFGERRG